MTRIVDDDEAEIEAEIQRELDAISADNLEIDDLEESDLNAYEIIDKDANVLPDSIEEYLKFVHSRTEYVQQQVDECEDVLHERPLDDTKNEDQILAKKIKEALGEDCHDNPLDIRNKVLSEINEAEEKEEKEKLRRASCENNMTIDIIRPAISDQVRLLEETAEKQLQQLEEKQSRKKQERIEMYERMKREEDERLEKERNARKLRKEELEEAQKLLNRNQKVLQEKIEKEKKQEEQKLHVLKQEFQKEIKKLEQEKEKEKKVFEEMKFQEAEYQRLKRNKAALKIQKTFRGYRVYKQHKEILAQRRKQRQQQMEDKYREEIERKAEDERKVKEMSKRKRIEEDRIIKEEKWNKEMEEQKRKDEEERRMKEEERKIEEERKRELEVLERKRREEEEKRRKDLEEKRQKEEERRKLDEIKKAKEVEERRRQEEDKKIDEERKQEEATKKEMEERKTKEEEERKMEEEKMAEMKRKKSEEIERKRIEEEMKDRLRMDEEKKKQEQQRTKEQNTNKEKQRKLDEEKRKFEESQQANKSHIQPSTPDLVNVEERRMKWLKDHVPWSSTTYEDRTQPVAKTKARQRPRATKRRSVERVQVSASEVKYHVFEFGFDLIETIFSQQESSISDQGTVITCITRRDVYAQVIIIINTINNNITIIIIIITTTIITTTIITITTIIIVTTTTIITTTIITIIITTIINITTTITITTIIITTIINNITTIINNTIINNTTAIIIIYTIITITIIIFITTIINNIIIIMNNKHMRSDLSTCSNLQKLSLDNNQLIMTKGLSNLPRLQSLSCTNNHLPGVKEIDSCQLLQILNLTGNNLQKPPLLINHVLLRELWLDDNSISMLEPLANTWLPSLHLLSVTQNSISSIDSLEGFFMLKSLNISHNLISGEKAVIDTLLFLTQLDDEVLQPRSSSSTTKSSPFIATCYKQLKEYNDMISRHHDELSLIDESTTDPAKIIQRLNIKSQQFNELHQQSVAHLREHERQGVEQHSECTTAVEEEREVKEVSKDEQPEVEAQPDTGRTNTAAPETKMQKFEQVSSHRETSKVINQRKHTEAAVKIQAVWRGWHIRHLIDVQMKRWLAAVTIQTTWRGYSVRSRIKRKSHVSRARKALWDARHDAAATTIQACYRGYRVRHILAQALQAVKYDSSDDDDFNYDEEVDLSAFDFDAGFLEGWTPTDTPQLPSRGPALPKTGETRIPSKSHQPRQAWRSADSPMGLDPATNQRRVPGIHLKQSPELDLVSVKSGTHSHLTHRAEEMSNEWGLKSALTAELMWKRANKMKYNPARKRRLLDPTKRLALFKKLDEANKLRDVKPPPKRQPQRVDYFAGI
ncbi:hypothetical protein QZH41_011874 [Actinostola sp. cb2023]|nr:hypothetical protein QZH41_011874 [Actinostola sp. cb2023]